jgi:flagellar basal-body rod modification protein FlgD
MDLTPILAGSGGSTAPLSKKQLDKDAFMQLLVAQLKNQDPMEPRDNGEQIAQLAHFSSLEQMQQLNEGMLSLIVLNQGNAQISQLAQGSALIGQTVQWNGGKGVVSGLAVEDGLVVAQVGSAKVPLIDVTAVEAPPATPAPANAD